MSFIVLFDSCALQNISCSSWRYETLWYILFGGWRCMLKYFSLFFCAVLIVVTSWMYTVNESKKHLIIILKEKTSKEIEVLLQSVLDKITDSNLGEWPQRWVVLRSVALGKVTYWVRHDRIGGFLIQAPPSHEPGLAMQPHYEAPSDFKVKNCKNTVINIGCLKRSPQEWPKVGCGAAK